MDQIWAKPDLVLIFIVAIQIWIVCCLLETFEYITISGPFLFLHWKSDHCMDMSLKSGLRKVGIHAAEFNKTESLLLLILLKIPRKSIPKPSRSFIHQFSKNHGPYIWIVRSLYPYSPLISNTILCACRF